MSKGFFGKVVGYTKEKRPILYDSIRNAYGIDEGECLREPTPEEMKDIQGKETSS